MKKILFVAVLGMITLSSCKKDYTCACTFTGGATLNIAIEKSSKKDAESACDSAESTYKVADAAASCSL